MTSVLAEPSPGLLRAAPIDFHRHTMGLDSLLRYLQLKVHHLAQEQDWDAIRVIGDYDRTAVVSRFEKTGKLFNIERPTATVRGRELIVRAFPGADYVQHYALIIATFLAMTGRPADIVTYQPPGRRSAEQPSMPSTCPSTASWSSSAGVFSISPLRRGLDPRTRLRLAARRARRAPRGLPRIPAQHLGGRRRQGRHTTRRTRSRRRRVRGEGRLTDTRH